ncbi:MAG: HAD hydrolase family protein [Saprospiraceae bacterium]|nr:HAD hydrolase family protein [Saprospiraceae bacterium]MCZ2338512.1 HAD hydrolase family protein [Chitinophagales bacterium]
MIHSLIDNITTFVFDVDGVFTNSNVLVLESGDLLRTMNTRDGQGVKIALEAGYNIAIMTKGYSSGVRRRFEILGVKYIYDKLEDKSHAFNNFIADLNLKKEEVLYMGDDIPDLRIYPLAGISVAPANAAPENLQRAMYITSRNGGEGCVREIIEKVMRQQGKWNF